MDYFKLLSLYQLVFLHHAVVLFECSLVTVFTQLFINKFMQIAYHSFHVTTNLLYIHNKFQLFKQSTIQVHY